MHVFAQVQIPRELGSRCLSVQNEMENACHLIRNNAVWNSGRSARVKFFWWIDKALMPPRRKSGTRAGDQIAGCGFSSRARPAHASETGVHLFYRTSKERSLAPACRSGRGSWSDARFIVSVKSSKQAECPVTTLWANVPNVSVEDGRSGRNSFSPLIRHAPCIMQRCQQEIHSGCVRACTFDARTCKKENTWLLFSNYFHSQSTRARPPQAKRSTPLLLPSGMAMMPSCWSSSCFFIRARSRAES